MWYGVMALSAVTLVVPLIAAALRSEKLEFRYFVIGPMMLTAALYELRRLRRRV